MRIKILSCILGIILCLLSYTAVNASNMFNIENKSKNGEISLNCLDQFGFDVLYDPFNFFRNKLFIINVYSNSSAQKADLKISDEILKINDRKIKDLTIYEIFDILTNENQINLEIKSRHKKHKVDLLKSNICTTKYTNETDTYFEEIYDNDIHEIDRILRYSSKISNKLSKGMQNYIRHQQRNTNYWIIKRYKLEDAYNICKSSYKNSIAQHNCIFSTINKQLADTKRHNRFFSNLKNAQKF